MNAKIAEIKAKQAKEDLDEAATKQREQWDTQIKETQQQVDEGLAKLSRAWDAFTKELNK